MIKFRPACLDDAESLYAWRNDPETRANSCNSSALLWDRHVAWFRSSLDDPDMTFLVAERHGQALGTVRIDKGELSWAVAPEHRGKGVGKEMVALAVSLKPTFARIKSTNIASQKIAESAGFRLAQDGELQIWRLP